MDSTITLADLIGWIISLVSVGVSVGVGVLVVVRQLRSDTANLDASLLAPPRQDAARRLAQDIQTLVSELRHPSLAALVNGEPPAILVDFKTSLEVARDQIDDLDPTIDNLVEELNALWLLIGHEIRACRGPVTLAAAERETVAEVLVSAAKATLAGPLWELRQRARLLRRWSGKGDPPGKSTQLPGPDHGGHALGHFASEMQRRDDPKWWPRRLLDLNGKREAWRKEARAAFEMHAITFAINKVGLGVPFHFPPVRMEGTGPLFNEGEPPDQPELFQHPGREE